jgi:hypothetical protein
MIQGQGAVLGRLARPSRESRMQHFLELAAPWEQRLDGSTGLVSISGAIHRGRY